MGAKRTNMLALSAAALFIALGTSAADAQQTAQDQYISGIEDTQAARFTRHLSPALDYRKTRLIGLDQFTEMQADGNTVILDTRSASAFARGHIAGAINLPFSGMTLLGLADAVPDRTSRILIYGDRNIAAHATRLDYEPSVLPLNLLTYISLYHYGYFDLYELGEKGVRGDNRLDWSTDGIILTAAGSPGSN